MVSRIGISTLIEELQELREKCKKAFDNAESESEKYFFKGRMESYTLLIMSLLKKID